MRYRRINLDGKSVTETRVSGTDLTPGTLVGMVAGMFVKATDPAGRLYVVHPGTHQGLGIADDIPAGDSVVGEYVEEGRELAVLCVAGTYAKDAPVGFDGEKGTYNVSDTDPIMGYSQDDVVLSGPGLIRVRMRAQPGLPEVDSVTITAEGGATGISTPGGTLQLYATVLPAGSNPAVIWSSGDGAATVDENGLVTAVSNNSSVVITATSVSNSGKTDTITLNISNQ